GVVNVAATILGRDLRLALVRECFGLDLDDSVSRTRADRLDAIVPGRKVYFASDLAFIVDDEIAALAWPPANRRTGEEEQAAWTCLRPERAGDRAAAGQRDFHPLRRVGAGAQVIGSIDREREVGNSAHGLRAHSLNLAVRGIDGGGAEQAHRH